ncbi:MAG: WXG100 family type VII secretion target [Candidatus Phosphoribacter sp.]|nr:WXG100 family type VII secretion target [Actinomycetales bacterium]
MAFTVDTERIHAASGDITRIAGDIEQSVAAMSARLQAMSGSWTGTAANEFQAVMTEWRAIQARVREDLVTIGQLTARAGTSYQQTEDAVRGLFAH